MPQGIPKSPSRWRFWDTLFRWKNAEYGRSLRQNTVALCGEAWSLTEAQHCSSLCLQSEGREDGPAATAKSVTFFAINTSPSLCEQSELQCCAANWTTMLAPQ